MRLFAGLVVLVLWAVPAMAAEVVLDGAVVQGGLVRGLAAPGARAFLDDLELRVSPDGRFVFGFGRDDSGPVTLRVRFADGREETRALEVGLRTYKVQRINGLPPRQVTPNPEPTTFLRPGLRKSLSGPRRGRFQGSMARSAFSTANRDGRISGWMSRAPSALPWWRPRRAA
jgi:hypothetical protein